MCRIRFSTSPRGVTRISRTRWSDRRRNSRCRKPASTLRGVITTPANCVSCDNSEAAVEIKAGDRIAQLRIVRRIEAEFDEVTELVEASRGAKGFGSTGR